MAKYRKKPVIVEAEVYRLGMEDGFVCEFEHSACLPFFKKSGENQEAGV